MLTETGTQTRNRSGEPRPAKHTEEPASPQMTWHMEFSWGRKKKKKEKNLPLSSPPASSPPISLSHSSFEREKKKPDKAVKGSAAFEFYFIYLFFLW